MREIETAATKKPWRRFGGMVDGYGICDANNNVVIPQEAFNGLHQHSAEILRCVNSFDGLVAALTAAKEHLDYCGYGDKWEREVAAASELEKQIDAALAVAGE